MGALCGAGPGNMTDKDDHLLGADTDEKDKTPSTHKQPSIKPVNSDGGTAHTGGKSVIDELMEESDTDSIDVMTDDESDNPERPRISTITSEHHVLGPAAVRDRYWFSLITEPGVEQQMKLDTCLGLCETLSLANKPHFRQNTREWKTCVDNAAFVALQLRRFCEKIAETCKVGIALDKSPQRHSNAADYFEYCQCAIIHPPDWTSLERILEHFDEMPKGIKFMGIRNGYQTPDSDGWASIKILIKLTIARSIASKSHGGEAETAHVSHICTIELIQRELWEHRRQGSFDLKQRAFIDAKTIKVDVPKLDRERGCSEFEEIPDEEVVISGAAGGPSNAAGRGPMPLDAMSTGRFLDSL